MITGFCCQDYPWYLLFFLPEFELTMRDMYACKYKDTHQAVMCVYK
jgi:hypothetical protein